MARLSTCKNCGVKMTKEEKMIYSNKSYCKECYDKLIYEKEEYKKLIDLICTYFKIEVPTGLIFKQIKDYKEQFGYNYAGMMYTLWFIKEIENKNFTEIKYGVALIKYNYEKAKAYFEQQSKIENSITEKPKEIIKTVTIKPIINKNKKNEMLFNIESLFKRESGDNN